MEVSKINGYDIKDKKAVRTYDTVASMKIDGTVKLGQHVKTRGYYEINDGGSAEYYITDTESLTDYQEELNSGLYATLIVENGEINLKQVGIKSNDSTFDNSVILNSIFNNTHYAHYSFYIPDGEYYIDNTIELTRKCDNFILRGNGHYSDSGLITGTKLIYTGNSYCFKFNLRFWRSTIENFDIYSTTGSGIYFVEAIHLGKIRDIMIKTNVSGIKIDRCGYTFIDRVNINDFSESTDFISFDLRSLHAVEYLYINKCTSQIYGSGTTYGIYSYGYNHLFITDCDFVNFSYCLYIDAQINTKYITINRTNFISNVICIYLYSHLASVSGVYITECSFLLRGNDGRILKTEKDGTLYARGLIFNNNHIMELDITTDYLIEIGENSLQGNSSTINNNGYNTNPIPFINFVYARNSSLLGHSFIENVDLALNGDETTTSYTYTLSTSSPFSTIPAILITDSKGLVSDYSISNTQHGTLSVTINFSSAWQGRNYICIHVLSDAKSVIANIS